MANAPESEQRPSQLARRRVFGFRTLLIVSALSLGACASYPPAVRSVPAAAPPPSTQVYFYPTKGQSPAQQDRDRYECYSWASKQTQFDPSQPQLPPHQRLEIVSQPPIGHDAVSGAFTGAVLGAAVSHHGRSAEGAVIGAIAGTLLGAASDAARQEQAERIQERHDRRAAHAAAHTEQQASAYRRAMGACLEGRDYTVH